MKCFARFSLLLALLMGGSLFCFAQRGEARGRILTPSEVESLPSAWREFTSPEGRFTVLLPGTPERSVEAVDTALGKLTTHTFSLTTSAQYMLMYADYPVSFEDSGRAKAALDSGRDLAVKNVKGRVTEERDVTVEGHPGRYLKVQTAIGFTIRSELVAVKNRLYTLAFITDERDVPADTARHYEQTAARFFDSFRPTSGQGAEGQTPPGGAKGDDTTSQTEGEAESLLKSLRGKKELVIGKCAEGAKCGPLLGADGKPAELVEGKVISKPQPAYPAVAKAARAQGTVVVQMVVDEEGKVMAAQAVSGHPLLRHAAVKAAREALFLPTLLDGKPVKVTGTITYNFNLQ